MKCKLCKQRLSLVDEEIGLCKCSNVFCVIHRHPSVHECTFDWKSRDTEILSRQLNKCTEIKIPVI